ncbi:MAG: hypothetical protein FD129_3234, partial [bacterium]
RGDRVADGAAPDQAAFPRQHRAPPPSIDLDDRVEATAVYGWTTISSAFEAA